MDKSLKKRWIVFKKLISLIRPINSTLVGFSNPAFIINDVFGDAPTSPKIEANSSY